MKYHKLNTFENMLTNIIAEGKYATWQEIELEPDAFKRVAKRKLYKQAVEKMKNGK